MCLGEERLEELHGRGEGVGKDIVWPEYRCDISVICRNHISKNGVVRDCPQRLEVDYLACGII